MEKYNKYRDVGSGISPFLPLQPTYQSPTLISHLITVVTFLVAIIRFVLLLAVSLVHIVVVEILGMVFGVVGLGYLWKRALGGVTTRFGLLIMGYLFIPSPEIVATRRGKGITVPSSTLKSWPTKGDLIVCNWTSYIELLWLSFRFNPTFILPIYTPVDLASSDPSSTGRHTGTGSANLPTMSSVPISSLLGYKVVSLRTIINLTGYTPEKYSDILGNDVSSIVSLEVVRRRASGPVVVLPEATTTNGRAILRFGEGVGKEIDVPVKGYKVWVMYFKHPPPSTHSPSVTHPSPFSTPSFLPNPLPHILLSTLSTLQPRSLSIKLLHSDSSPSSGSFLPSECLGLDSTSPLKNQLPDDVNVLSECLMSLLLLLGRTKKLGMGWEDKEGFFEFVREKKESVGGKRVVSEVKEKQKVLIGRGGKRR